MNRNAFALLVGVSIAVGGCTMIPKYDRPGAPIPDRWPGGDAYLTNQPTTRPSDAARLTRREFFCDEKLRQVIEMAVRNNRDLRLAALNAPCITFSGLDCYPWSTQPATEADRGSRPIFRV